MKALFLCMVSFFTFNHVCFCQSDRIGFLNELLNEKDYFRAITILKELRFESIADLQTRSKYEYMIGFSYYKSAKYENAIDYFTLLTENPTISPSLLHQSRVLLSLSYYGLKMYDYSLMELHNIISKDSTYSYAIFYESLLQTERKRFEQAENQLQSIIKKDNNSILKEKSEKIYALLQKRSDLSFKSPLFAGLLSTVVPGLGQMYSQHYFDGVQALGFVGALGYATYASYQYSSNVKGNYVGTAIIGFVTTMFHLSNILGAVKTAEFRNNRVYDEYMSEIRNTYLSVDLSLPLR